MKNYFLVNTVTAISLVLGLTAIICVLNGYLKFSFGFALLAFVSDSLDGYLARLLKAESRFGAIFDTIADIFVYLIYPAILLYQKFEINNLVGVLFISLFLLTGIFRLIRFTVNGLLLDDEKKYYLGMPVFFSYLIIAIMMIVSVLDKTLLQITGVLLLGTMSVMMITSLKFRKPTSIFLGMSMCGILAISISMFYI